MGAIQDYNEAIEFDPEDTWMGIYKYHKRGDAKYRLKDYAGAIQDFTKAIELDPKYVHWLISAGDVPRSN